MAGLTARFSLIDDMSSRLSDIAEQGQSMISQWEKAGAAADMAFNGISDNSVSAASVADGVSVSIAQARDELDAMGDGWEKELDAANRSKAGIEEISASTDTLTDTMSGYENAAEEAAAQTDAWTAAVGNYDKSMLEAVYSTEELVNMGLKSATTLEEQERVLELCEQSASSLGRSIEATADIQGELEAAITKAAGAVEQQNYAEGVSIDTKSALSAATMDALSAMRELTAAQEEEAASMEAYDSVMASGTADLDTLEPAAERACHAAENLAEANGKASSATEDLSKATETAATEAESTVVLATGATGAALDGLTASMMDAYAASKTGSLDDTAAAIGKINTRLGYTDGILTDTTELFLDFAAATGGNAASSVRSVTQLMNQWNVLATQANLTGTQEEELAAITKKLAESYPDLAEQFDSATMSAEEYVAAMERACEQQAQETFTEALQKQAQLEEEIAKAEANLNAEHEARGMYYDEQMK